MLTSQLNGTFFVENSDPSGSQGYCLFFALVVALAKGSNACSEGTLKIEQLNRILSLPPICIPSVKEMLNILSSNLKRIE